MTNVACVIEPEPSQFIGAWLLHQSLRENAAGPVDFRLTIVRRGGSEKSIVDCALALGIRTVAVPSSYANPLLNKWLWVDAFKDLQRARRVAMMDWDMILVSRSVLPSAVLGGIAARPNPASLYRDLVRRMPSELFPPGIVRSRGRVPTSLNGGLLIAGGPLLRRCARLAVAYESRIRGELAEVAGWESEQLALSVAVGELGYVPLPLEWNVTWRHRKLRRSVRLWHYSSAWGTMLELKRTLNRPGLALGCLRELRETFPIAVDCFLRHYSRAIEQRWFQDLIRQHPPEHATKVDIHTTVASCQRVRN